MPAPIRTEAVLLQSGLTTPVKSNLHLRRRSTRPGCEQMPVRFAPGAVLLQLGLTTPVKSDLHLSRRSTRPGCEQMPALGTKKGLESGYPPAATPAPAGTKHPFE